MRLYGREVGGGDEEEVRDRGGRKMMRERREEEAKVTTSLWAVLACAWSWCPGGCVCERESVCVYCMSVCIGVLVVVSVCVHTHACSPHPLPGPQDTPEE